MPKRSSAECLNDYRPVALTTIAVKCFEKLVLAHIKTIIPPDLDRHQFAYRVYRSTEDAITTALHVVLTHLGKPYVRLLFVDFSSVFNTVILYKLINKLNILGSTPLCVTGSWTFSQADLSR